MCGVPVKKAIKVTVKDGYGRNFLVPKGLAVAALEGNVKRLDSVIKSLQNKKTRELKTAEDLKAKLEEISLVIKMKAGDDGKLFGSVTHKDVAEAIKKAAGIEIDKKLIRIEEPIKMTGTYTVEVHLHAGCQRRRQNRGRKRRRKIMARPLKNTRETKEPGMRVPPQNIEAEQSLLGGLLVDAESMNKVADIVGAADFYRDSHSKIFALITDLYERNDAIDMITISSLARDRGILEGIGGVTYLNTLVDLMPSAANIAHYAKMVKEKSLLRRLMNVATEIIEKGFDAETNVDGYIDEAEKMIFQVAENKFKPAFFPIKDFVMENVKTIERLYEKKQTVTGIPTGFTDLDKLTSGLQNSDLIIVAGRPSMGKTAFAMNIAQNVATMKENPVPVGIFSMEMSKEQLVTRLLSSESDIEHTKLRTGTLSGAEWPRLAEAAGRLSDALMFIDDSPALSVLELRARSRRLKKEHGLGLLVVDYLQLMRGRAGADRREQEISEISRFLKALAKELNIPVIAISQLNRAPEQRSEGDKRPRLADLRESGAIEQDADVIMFIYRDEVYNKEKEDNKGVAEIIIGKQRNGPIDTVKLAFIDKLTTFRNLYYRE